MKRHYLISSIKALTTGLLIVVVVNILSVFWYHHFDLTEEKRYTLTTSTKKLLNSLDDKVDVEIYLTGKDLPAGIKILQNETRELLQEFDERQPATNRSFR